MWGGQGLHLGALGAPVGTHTRVHTHFCKDPGPCKHCKHSDETDGNVHGLEYVALSLLPSVHHQRLGKEYQENTMP